MSESPGTRTVAPEPGSMFGFRVIAGVLSILVAPFVKFDLPVPADRPAKSSTLWAPNHRSMFDTVVGLVGLHRLGYTASFFVTARYFRNPVVGRLLRWIGAVPVDPGSGGRQAMSAGIEHLRAGRSLVIMAEGRLVPAEARCNGIGPLEPGVIVLARRAGVPIVPAALIGADEVLPVGRRLPRVRLGSRTCVLVRFGSPVPVDGKSREALAGLAARLGDLVVAAEAEREAMVRGGR